ncbi:MAG: cytochrome c maturation protein CcmE [Deltaproteobacteria bacterium]|nr:cytochrome c maturation protein CcmE [Deltaproteobacteria bacterium]
MNLKRTLFTLLLIALIGGGLGYVLWGGLEQNLVYFVSPTELQAKGAAAVGNSVRLGGMVAKGSIQFNANVLTFLVTDTATQIPVVTTKAPPEMFQEEMGVVVEGALEADGHFRAERLMVKHGNEYRPPDEGEMPQELYKSIHQPAGQAETAPQP